MVTSCRCWKTAATANAATTAATAAAAAAAATTTSMARGIIIMLTGCRCWKTSLRRRQNDFWTCLHWKINAVLFDGPSLKKSYRQKKGAPPHKFQICYHWKCSAELHTALYCPAAPRGCGCFCDEQLIIMIATVIFPELSMFRPKYSFLLQCMKGAFMIKVHRLAIKPM